LTHSETATDDDNELVRRARSGEADRFTTLVRRHQDRVYRLTWRLVGPDAAEDVAQQAFLKAWLVWTSSPAGQASALGCIGLR
jgi:DNA-directed RNA polymerase specialized sigma24 family protein